MASVILHLPPPATNPGPPTPPVRHHQTPSRASAAFDFDFIVSVHVLGFLVCRLTRWVVQHCGRAVGVALWGEMAYAGRLLQWNGIQFLTKSPPLLPVVFSVVLCCSDCFSCHPQCIHRGLLQLGHRPCLYLLRRCPHQTGCLCAVAGVLVLTLSDLDAYRVHLLNPGRPADADAGARSHTLALLDDYPPPLPAAVGQHVAVPLKIATMSDVSTSIKQLDCLICECVATNPWGFNTHRVSMHKVSMSTSGVLRMLKLSAAAAAVAATPSQYGSGCSEGGGSHPPPPPPAPGDGLKVADDAAAAGAPVLVAFDVTAAEAEMGQANAGTRCYIASSEMDATIAFSEASGRAPAPTRPSRKRKTSESVPISTDPES